MRIRILDPHWKKWIQIRIKVISLRFTDFFLTKNNFQIFILFFSLIFICKLDEPIRNEEIFIISLFPQVMNWVLEVKKFFYVVFTPWIRIRGSAFFCEFGSGSRKPKYCGSGIPSKNQTNMSQHSINLWYIFTMLYILFFIILGSSILAYTIALFETFSLLK